MRYNKQCYLNNSVASSTLLDLDPVSKICMPVNLV